MVKAIRRIILRQCDKAMQAYDWIMGKLEFHKGYWVAIENKAIIDRDVDLIILMRKIKLSTRSSNPTYVYVSSSNYIANVVAFEVK